MVMLIILWDLYFVHDTVANIAIGLVYTPLTLSCKYKIIILQLQHVQNTAARLICNATRFDHISPVLVNLHWLPVRFRIIFKILVIAYEALHSVVPIYIRDLITIKPRFNYSLRSNNELLLVPPGCTKKTLGDCVFCAAAPKLWNNLPNNIRNTCSESIDIFKSKLKTYLFKKAFLDYLG